MLPHHSPSLKEWGQDLKQSRDLKLMQRLWGSAAYWLGPPGAFSLFSYISQDHLPRGSTAQNGLVLPHQTSIKKMHYRLVNPLVAELLNSDFFFPNDPTLCQVKNETNRIRFVSPRRG